MIFNEGYVKEEIRTGFCLSMSTKTWTRISQPAPWEAVSAKAMEDEHGYLLHYLSVLFSLHEAYFRRFSSTPSHRRTPKEVNSEYAKSSRLKTVPDAPVVFLTKSLS